MKEFLASFSKYFAFWGHWAPLAGVGVFLFLYGAVTSDIEPENRHMVLGTLLFSLSLMLAYNGKIVSVHPHEDRSILNWEFLMPYLFSLVATIASGWWFLRLLGLIGTALTQDQ